MMLWGDWFVMAGLVLYIGAAIAYGVQGQLPQTLIYLCYAGANAGLIWAAHWRVL